MSRRESFAVQLNNHRRGPAGRRGSTYAQRLSLAEQVGTATDEVTAPFTSKLAPNEMRQLALVAHNHMKPAMKQFIETYSEILKKFRITGTQTTMKMCKSMWGEDDPAIHYGLTCTSGPLGGDAQIAALMCMEDLGGIIFFVDPLSAHPHQADIDSLLRLANCGNVIVCPNPASASSMMHTLRCALLKGERARGMIPSFFETLESPAVEEYKHAQAVALANVIKGGSPAAAAPAPQAAEPPKEEKKMMDAGKRAVSFGDDVVEVDVKGEKHRSELSDTVVDRALMGQSMISCADLEALLLLDTDSEDEDEEDDTEEEENNDVVVSAPTAKVSKGLFGIRTKTATKSKSRMGMKKLGKSVRKMIIK
jgi:methylglyoxal synthase